MSDRPTRVLFLCTGNSARSQMAEALLRRHGGSGFEVASAGTSPRGVHPLTVRALAEVGVDASGARSKSIAEFLGQEFDWVVTVCDRARDACPTFPGPGGREHWGLDDPADAGGTEEEQLALFRRVRDEIDMRVQEFVPTARASRHVPSA